MKTEFSLDMNIDVDDWYKKCYDHGFDYALSTLTYYVNNKQPKSFLPSCGGARSMCKIASFGIEKKPINSIIELTDTKFGFDLYMKMFGNFDYE